MLTDPAVRAIVAGSYDSENPGLIAEAVLSLAAGARLRPGEQPWLADLALPGTDGEWYPAGELLLPGGPLTEVVAVDTPFGTLDPVMKNVKVQSPTGDMLVNQLRTKSLDAVIAYVSNATEADDELEAVAIDIPCAVAVQPFAVSKDTPHRQLATRLLNAIRSAESRERFESYGFHWYQATR